MTMNSRRLLALSAATALTVTLTPAALAQDGSDDGSVREAVVSSFADPASSGSSLDAALSSLSLVGSSEWPLPDQWREFDDDYPLPTDDSITDVELVEIQDEGQRLERWVVSSPSMKRNVEVQIWRAAGDGPPPMLKLHDGVGAPRTSWWLGPGIAPEVFAGENVTLVMPTQAQASMYADWLHDDPTLGRHQWETFLTAELAPLLDTAPSSTSTATAPSADCPWVPPARCTSPTATPGFSTPPSGSPAATRPWIRSAGRTPT